MYNVIILNDEYTTADFVVYILQKIFSMDYERAEKLMFQSHYEGQAVCGMYTLDIAETKIAQVFALSLQNDHPLRCTMETV
jgi:ATP-dependent Clp protease adaptor protein ClpS